MSIGRDETSVKAACVQSSFCLRYLAYVCLNYDGASIAALTYLCMGVLPHKGAICSVLHDARVAVAICHKDVAIPGESYLQK